MSVAVALLPPSVRTAVIDAVAKRNAALLVIEKSRRIGHGYGSLVSLMERRATRQQMRLLALLSEHGLRESDL